MSTESEKRSVRIKRMIKEVEDMLETQTSIQVSTLFPEWQKEFPKIFEMVLTRTYDRGLMAMMIEQFERVESGSKSQHDASVSVGSVLVDKIVKPQLSASGKKV